MLVRVWLSFIASFIFEIFAIAVIRQKVLWIGFWFGAWAIWENTVFKILIKLVYLVSKLTKNVFMFLCVFVNIVRKLSWSLTFRNSIRIIHVRALRFNWCRLALRWLFYLGIEFSERLLFIIGSNSTVHRWYDILINIQFFFENCEWRHFVPLLNCIWCALHLFCFFVIFLIFNIINVLWGFF